MNKIQRLPPEVSQKIAAGEVIERPFSVVKELVENAIDAGADDIRVELQAGGKRLIRVQDNGSGMSREDASLCFERHATSKIATEADLERIATLGFRGEALASIAAVSELVLRTSDGLSEAGTRVERRSGDLVSIREAAVPKGTSVEVRNLFFNLPARRKFLRSDQSELGLITRYLTASALAYPEVRFWLAHSQREILNCPAVGNLKDRIFEIYGRAALDRLIEVDFRERGGRLFGYSSRPPAGRPDKTHQLFFVNRRPVKDRTLQAALHQAYRGFLEKDLFPEAYFFLSLPPSEVDVNVHPAKAEVRFRDAQLVFYLVLGGVERAVLQEKNLKPIYASPAGETGRPGVEESKGWRPLDAPEKTPEQTRVPFPFPVSSAKDKTLPRVLGQYLDTYIVAAAEDGLLVIDQHNAHERVLFEKYQEVDAQKRWPPKAPLIPILFDLSPAQVLSLESHRSLLEEVGFRAEAMGERTFALVEFPDIFEAREAEAAFVAALTEMEEETEPARKRDKMLATLACKTAIKANVALSAEKMDYLVGQLFQTSNPAVCPHGRPVVVKVEKSQIEKGLKRVS
jgi:DNA mismatch repair protein MutL